jgi:hypothetical protein
MTEDGLAGHRARSSSTRWSESAACYPPPDFFPGDAAADVAMLIAELRGTLGCE